MCMSIKRKVKIAFWKKWFSPRATQEEIRQARKEQEGAEIMDRLLKSFSGKLK